MLKSWFELHMYNKEWNQVSMPNFIPYCTQFLLQGRKTWSTLEDLMTKNKLKLAQRTNQKSFFQSVQWT